MRYTIAGLALGLILAAGHARALVSFQTTEEEDAIEGADNPQALTIADVNGDGVGDIIAALPLDDAVMVFYNDGAGEIDFDDFFDTDGVTPIAVATGLFNADNFTDIVAANYDDGTVSILLNDTDGDGDFNFDHDPRRFQVAANPIGIVVGELNGDDIDDLAVLSPNTIYLLQGNGDGTFSPFNPATISTRSDDSFAIAAGNLNADTFLDLVVTNRGGGQMAVFLGAGDGSFSFNGFVNTGHAPTGLLVADVDGDGRDDLIVVDSEALILDEVLFIRNAGNAQFEAPEAVTGPERAWAITGLDVEPDGKVDLAVTSTLQDESFLLCQLSGKCTQPPFGGGLEAGIWRSAAGGTIPGCRQNGQIAITSGKLNGDDMDDLVALSGDLTTLCISLNRSVISLTPTPDVTATPSPPPSSTPKPGNGDDDGCAIGGNGGGGAGIVGLLAGCFVILAVRPRRAFHR